MILWVKDKATAVAKVQALAQEFPKATGAAKKKREKEKKTERVKIPYCVT